MARNFKYQSRGPSKNRFLTLEMEGVEDMETALRKLGQDRLIRRTMRRGLLKVTRPAAETAKRLAPKTGTGKMAAKIRASTTLSRRQRRGGHYRFDPNVAYVWLGAGPRGPGVLTEFGTGPRYTKKGAFRGAAPAQPFLRPAWEQHKHQILKDLGPELWKEINKSAKRLARRQAKKAAK